MKKENMFLKKFSSRKQGFTLIEILIVIGIIAILAGIVIVAMNPGQRFKDANNSQRKANLQAIMSAIHLNIVDNKGTTTCPAFPNTATNISSVTGEYDLASCLSNYLAVLPFDPSASGASWTSSSNYNTKYSIRKVSNGQIELSAPNAEGTAIVITE